MDTGYLSLSQNAILKGSLVVLADDTGYSILDTGLMDTCHCIKSQYEKRHKDRLCCEQADGEGEDQADVVVRQDDHLNWAILNIGNRQMYWAIGIWQLVTR